MVILKFLVCTLAYCFLFSIFEYINAINMTSGSWKSILGYAIKPHILAFFALSPVLVWGLNKEIYEASGSRFWYTGIILSFIEFLSYFLGSLIFYRKFPTLRECAGLALMLLALLVAYKAPEE